MTKKKFFYPTNIQPRCDKSPWALRWQSTSGVCGQEHLQPLSRDTTWDSVCKDNDTVISWGEPHPDQVNHSPTNFYNMITSAAGSYSRPTPFYTKDGWKDTDNIPNSAKIKSIKVYYAWDQVYFFGTYMTYNRKGNEGPYRGGGGVFGAPQIKLRIKGKDLSATGASVRSISRCTRNNSYSYSTKDLGGEHSVTLSGVSGMTMGDFKKSVLTFIPAPNQYGDIARIVMRHIKVLVEYEEIPPTFSLQSIKIETKTITNCSGAKSKIIIKLDNSSVTAGTTEVVLSGSGIKNATISDVTRQGKDTLKKNSNGDRIWIVSDKCKNRSISFYVSYAQPGTYKITAKVNKNKGKITTKEGTIKVNSCEPKFNFQFLKKNTNNEYEENKKYIYSNVSPETVYFKLTLTKSQILSHNEKLQIDTDELVFNDNAWLIYTDGKKNNKISPQKKENIYTFTNIKEYKKIVIIGEATLNESGLYNIVGKYNNTSQSSWNAQKKYKIEVKGITLGKDYFKLRVEDGSDIKYNSLMISKGDDLTIPLTYTTEEIDKYISNMEIYGENKRIPLNETQYVHFTINLNTKEKVELKNVLTYIDIYSKDYNADNIIVGAGKGVELLENDESYICSIDSISSEEPTIIKFAVNSSIEIEDVVMKIKPYNFDGYTDEIGWIPSHIMFKDIPDIKISIEGISDLNYCEKNPNDKDIFWLYYKIQNLSNVDAKKVRFQLKEPQQFKKLCYVFEQENDCENIYDNENNDAWFNKNNRIITFETLEANSAERILAVKYQATRKGIYDFIIHTLDNTESLIDDQYENFYTHNLIVNIPSDVRITTNISKTLPYKNELIDFNIKIKNLHKKQKTFTFDIFDIGSYDIEHTTNDYDIEKNGIRCNYGTFVPSNIGNKIGTWTLNDIDINQEYYLTLSLRPKDIGNHIIKTVFTNQINTACEDDSIIVKDFYNEVNIIEPNKQIEFNVYHAVSDDNSSCDDCENLIKICDDDFINLGDNIYYVFEVKNNSRNKINNALHIYARLPESFLTNGVLCSSRNYLLNQTNNLISFTIPELPGCLHEDSTIKFCIKIKPSDIGKFISNFSLSTRNSKVLYKQLTLTVDTEFNNRQLEHEIKIYNFEKTNKYYRYEMDDVGNIFKFFNTADKTLRPIESEDFSKKSVEVFKGSNLRQLVEQIKENSKYVDPLLLRTGTNKLLNKGYELFPDGLIRRFGLLNSEVYHYTGQFPKISDLVDKAMKWDIDTWDTKVWAGDPYDNGIFNLSVDYTKIPSNFDILDDTNFQIKNLQNLVDNVKPYGTKAICHYAATIQANIQISLDKVVSKIKHDININLHLPNDFAVTTYCNRFDDTLTVYHDLTETKLKLEIERLINEVINKEKDSNKMLSSIDEVHTHIFADKINKITTEDCYDMITDAYNTNTQPKNIDIIKPLNNNYDAELDESLHSIQIIKINDKLKDKESIGFIITPHKNVSIRTRENVDDKNNIDNNNIYCIYMRNDIENFLGFKFIINDTIIQERNMINEDINNINIQIQSCNYNNNNILHFWGSINDNDYYHIGLCELNDFNQPSCNIYNQYDYQYERYSISNNIDSNISFKISDKIKDLNKKHSIIKTLEKNNKWQYLKNINNNKYAYFENKINVDAECSANNKKINVPKIILKYDNIDIDDLDEIVDIQFKIDAQTNKNNFEDDICIDLYKDGDAYIPENDTGRQIYYPSLVVNSNQKFLANIEIEQDNITICSHCLKTALGYHEKCPYCESTHVQYTNEKTAATACYNCDWITNGWHDYCPHCLSYDIEKIQIDFNKTYCENCETLSPDYYEHCPQCFSSNVIHLTNNINKYSIFGEDRQNIEPIIIKNVDIDKLDIFSLHIPLNHYTDELKQLSYLTLKIHGTNNNDGKYYYCEACNSGGIGNYEKCPYCKSNLIHNESISSYSIEPYYENCNSIVNYRDIDSIGEKCKNRIEHYTPIEFNSSIPIGDFVKEIDLKKCAEHNYLDKFKLIFTLENQQYNQIANIISQLPIKDEYQAEILESLSLINININNLSLDYKYENETEWVNLDKLEYSNHTGISYRPLPYSDKTDIINFKDFNIEKKKYKKATLYVAGLLKNMSNDITMNIKINNDDEVKNFKTTISDTLFMYNKDILNDAYIDNMSIEINFEDVEDIGEIIITDCHIVTEWIQYEDIIHDNINTFHPECIKENNCYLFKSENLWGLKNYKPYYLSGKQLNTNLIGYIDFGKLNLDEYIRLYNIEMIIYYKAKNGNIVTSTISKKEEDNTFKNILIGVGYSIEEIDEIISNNIPLNTALEIKDKYIDNINIEQLLSGDIDSISGLLWGEITYSDDVVTLNNLESENIVDDDSDELINDIPLYYKIAQSFNTGDDITSIDTLYIDYFGKNGYPNSNISVYLCEDYNGKPDNIIANNKVQTNNISEVLNINLNVHNLKLNTKYWIVIEDVSANKNNYHRLCCNNNLEFGQLLTYDDEHYNYESYVLSFGISTIKRDKIFYNLPTTWIFDTDNFDGYKIHYNLYRYNIEDNSNISLSNFLIKSGYRLADVQPSLLLYEEENENLENIDDDIEEIDYNSLEDDIENYKVYDGNNYIEYEDEYSEYDDEEEEEYEDDFDDGDDGE